MQGKKAISPKMMFQIHLDDLVPKENFYRKLSDALDLRFLYKETEKHYGKEGQESIDPVGSHYKHLTPNLYSFQVSTCFLKISNLSK